MTDNGKAIEALISGGIILAPVHTHACGSSHKVDCVCGASKNMTPLIEAIYTALQTAPSVITVAEFYSHIDKFRFDDKIIDDTFGHYLARVFPNGLKIEG